MDRQSTIRAALTLCAALLLPGVAAAQVRTPAAAQEVTLQADIDHDGKPDTVTSTLDPRRREFWVTVQLSSGRTFWPLAGYVDPRRARLSLSFREASAGGDIRCAEWRPVARGRGLGCGAAVGDANPSRVVVVDTGLDMFLLIYSEGYGHADHRPIDNARGYFRVMPAIAGGLSVLD